MSNLRAIDVDSLPLTNTVLLTDVLVSETAGGTRGVQVQALRNALYTAYTSLSASAVPPTTPPPTLPPTPPPTTPPGVTIYALTLLVSPGGTGTISGSGLYATGSTVLIHADAIAGYHFVNWTGNVSTVQNVNSSVTQVTVNGNYTITANFAADVVPTNPPVVPPTFKFSYINSVGAPRYDSTNALIVGFTPDGSTDITVTIDPGNVTADFPVVISGGVISSTITTPGLKTFTTTVAAGGHTIVASSVTPYLNIVSVSVQRTAGGYFINGSSRCLVNTANTFNLVANGIIVGSQYRYNKRDCTDNINQPSGTITANGTENFVAIPVSSGFKIGFLELNPLDLNFTSPSVTPTAGQNVIWSGGGTTKTTNYQKPTAGTGSQTIYNPNSFGVVVDLNTSDSGPGTFSPNSGSIIIPAAGTQVINSAYSGSGAGSKLLTITAREGLGSITYLAFVNNTYTLVAYVGTGSGSIATATGTFNAGTTQPLVAVPAPSYSFVTWSGDIAGIADTNAQSTTIVMNGDYTVFANFQHN